MYSGGSVLAQQYCQNCQSFQVAQCIIQGYNGHASIVGYVCLGCHAEFHVSPFPVPMPSLLLTSPASVSVSSFPVSTPLRCLSICSRCTTVCASSSFNMEGIKCNSCRALEVTMPPESLQALTHSAAAANPPGVSSPLASVTSVQKSDVCFVCQEPGNRNPRVVSFQQGAASPEYIEFKKVFNHEEFFSHPPIKLCFNCYRIYSRTARYVGQPISLKKIYEDRARVLRERPAPPQRNNSPSNPSVSKLPRKKYQGRVPGTKAGMPRNPRCGKCGGTLFQKSSDRGWLCFSCDKAPLCPKCRVHPLKLQQTCCDSCQKSQAELAQKFRVFAQMSSQTAQLEAVASVKFICYHCGGEFEKLADDSTIYCSKCLADDYV